MSYQALDEIEKEVLQNNVFHQEYEGMHLYCHTRSCIVDSAWNETTKRCRGIVFDDHGHILCRPFDKFFNIDERPETSSKIVLDRMRNEPFYATQKMDGTLVNVFYYRGWRCATKGSLVSWQAKLAEELLEQYEFDLLPMNPTYCCELITPKDKKVVDYKGETKLVVLAAFEPTWELKEIDRDNLRAMLSNTNIPYVDNMKVDINDLRGCIPEGEEGFVVSFDDGKRFKVKSHWYFTCHKLLSEIRPKNILELIRLGNYKTFLESLPEHLREEADDIYAYVMGMYLDYKESADYLYDKIKDLPDIKSKALWIQRNLNNPRLRTIMFVKMHDKDIHQVITKMIGFDIKDNDQ